MRIISQSKERDRKHSGFTLIEVLVVITIIGILAGVVVLSVNINSDNRALESTANRLHALFYLAQEEAVILNEEYGIEVFNDGYRFLQWQEPQQMTEEAALAAGDTSQGDVDESAVVVDQDQQAQAEGAEKAESNGYWGLALGDKYRSQYSFPAGIRVWLEVEDSEVDLVEMALAETDKQATEDQEAAELQPMIFFLSSGEATPFKLELFLEDSPEKKYILTGDLAGRLKFYRPGEELLRESL